MASSALRSALRFTACMQAVNLKTKLRRRLSRAPSTISRELRRNSWPTKVWTGGYEPVRAQQLAERRRRWDGRFKLARQPDLRDCVSKSLAMGHSPEQIAGRLALRTWSRHHQPRVNLSFHLSSLGPERLLASPAAAPQIQTRAPATPRRQPRQPHQTTALDHRTTRRGRRPRRRRAIGKPTSCCSPDMARDCWFSTNGKPASASFTIRSIEKLSSRLGPSPVNSANFHRRCAKPSASTMGPSSPSITGFTKPSASRPSSVIPTVLGKKAAWKIRSAACDAGCLARPISISSRQPI